MAGGKKSSLVWTVLTRVAAIVGLIGGVLGVCGFGLSYYQWTVAQDQIRISAALDISKSYLQDKELRDIQDSIQTTKPVSRYDKTHLRQRVFVDLNNYIAQLVNANLIDERYISVRIKCDISWLYRIVQGERADLADETTEIARYAGRAKAACEMK